MKTMSQVNDVNVEWLPAEQKAVASVSLKQGADVYLEGPYLCNYHNKYYGYIWIDNGRKLAKIDGRGYDVKLQSELHPKII